MATSVSTHLRGDLITAATLHDIGYGHPVTGFHPIDGARFLADRGFSRVVCHLVAHHSASSYEARERGIHPDVFREFAISDDWSSGVSDIGRAHAALWWADMTTGPDGQVVTVEQRLAEISSRYGPDDPVSRFIGEAREILISAGQLPIGSIQVPS